MEPFARTIDAAKKYVVSITVRRKRKSEDKKRVGVAVTEQIAPKSAFASYAKQDRRDVLSRVRSLQIFTGIDVFLDCRRARDGTRRVGDPRGRGGQRGWSRLARCDGDRRAGRAGPRGAPTAGGRARLRRYSAR